jgi:hypothetical protein
MNVKTSLQLIPALAAALLAGCMSDPAESEGPSLVGESLASLKGAKAAAAIDGKLYVGNRDSSATGIAVVDLASGEITAFHASTLPPNDLALAGDSVLVVSGTDFSTGALSRLSLKTGAWTPEYLTVGSDNALTAAGDKVFLMDRSTNVVTGFTGGRLEDANVFLNVNTGAESNPYQVALHGGKAFVTRYGSAHLLVLEADRKDGGTRDSIDLSAWAADSLKGTPGAVPHMDAAVAYGGRIFVTVQRLTGWAAKDTSKVLAIDAITLRVTGEIALERKNPTSVSVRGKWLYVSCVDGYGTFTGAVERIDMEKAEHAGIVVEEQDLTPPSDLTQFVPVSDDRGYVIHTPDFKTGHISPVAVP